MKNYIIYTFAIALLAGCDNKPKTIETEEKTVAKTEHKEIVTTESGLKYIEHSVGTGKIAAHGKKVSVHYIGTLENGDKFDSSHDRKEPIKFKLGAGQVIKGWDEGLKDMKVGGKRKLIIPADLAYGNNAVGKIPAGSVLHFEVEIVDVED